MTQQDRVLDYLKVNKSITPMKAWDICGVYRLADTIYKLRKKGHHIGTVDKDVMNKFGEKCTVAEYVYYGPQIKA